MISKILDVLSGLFQVILGWFGRNPKTSIDPKIKEAIRIKGEIDDLTNAARLKLQQRDIEGLREDLDSLESKLDAVLDRMYSQKPPDSNNPNS